MSERTPQIHADAERRRIDILTSQRLADERFHENESLLAVLRHFHETSTPHGRVEVVKNHSFVVFRTGGVQGFAHHLAVRRAGSGFEVFVYDGGKVKPQVRSITRFDAQDQMERFVAAEVERLKG